MVDFDLRELSAPIEALEAEILVAYVRLDKRWSDVVSALKKLPMPCGYWHAFSEDVTDPNTNTCLEWRKWNGSKRLCIVEHWLESTPYGPEGREEVIPYEEWSGEQRIEMLEHIPELFKAAERQIKEFIDKTKSTEAKS